MNNALKYLLMIIPILAIISGAGLSIYMAHKQAVTWVHPDRTLSENTPSELGLYNWDEIQFQTADDINISGWFIQPDTSSEPKPTVIFLHGLGANREAMLEQAALLVNRGYNALLIDLRNHGLSGGDVTTLGYKEVEDVRAAVDYLLTREEVDSEHIGLVGASLGGVTAIRAAARIPQVQVVVAQSTFKTVDDNVTTIVQALTGRPPFPFPAAVIWFVNRETGVNVSDVRAIDDLAQLTSRPVLFIHGADDPVVPLSNSQDMYETADEPKQLLVIQNAGHGGLMDAAPEEFESQFTDFLDEHLKGE